MNVVAKSSRSDTESYFFLKARQRAIRDSFPPEFGLRIHRALSWLGRAEQETGDSDARFLFLWIAFNAAYADDLDLVGERARRDVFFRKLEGFDTDRRLYGAVWQRFSGPIRLLMQSKFAFQPFWDYQNGDDHAADWEMKFTRSARRFAQALQGGDTIAILTHLFDRLYVLRNQVMHGGSTWNSRVNREQMRDGANILGFLVPVFIDLMMDHPDEDWGRPFYPVVGAA